MSKEDNKSAAAAETKAASAPPADKAIKIRQVYAKVKKQPLMTDLGVKVKGQVFPCSEKDAERYGPLVIEGTAAEYEEEQKSADKGPKELQAYLEKKNKV